MADAKAKEGCLQIIITIVVSSICGIIYQTCQEWKKPRPIRTEKYDIYPKQKIDTVNFIRMPTKTR